ncbi:MAG TPA: four helix bundle protein [Pyrinomonadaceae bacterium]|nr:four helix bundle protein [Pyrinomonadaceae bacterium]
MTKVERFEDMECWKKARELTKVVYEISSVNKFAHDFGLRDQIRRASVSILSNIEGFERDGNKEFIQFLSMAKGSCGEVRAQLYVALDQQYISKEQFETIIKRAIEVNRIISGLIKYLRQSAVQGRKFI